MPTGIPNSKQSMSMTEKNIIKDRLMDSQTNSHSGSKWPELHFTVHNNNYSNKKTNVTTKV